MAADLTPEQAKAYRIADNKTAELVRLLSSTPLGEVATELVIRRHRERAGLRIGDRRRVDLFRYAAWLVAARSQMPQKRTTPRTQQAQPDGYEAIRQRARARNLQLSLAGRDIAPLPPVADAQRRAEAERSLEFFLRTYFPEVFTLPFCQDHRKVIAAIQTAALEGGLFAYAMPRGSGKTSICERAALWAVMIGARPFVAVIGAEESSAEEILATIKTELESNDRLLADWPEVCYPVRRLEGITNRCRGQLYQGQPTRMLWTRKTIVLPTIPGSKASGAIIKVAGLTGRIRGMKHQRADGSSIRPSLVILDDPQTDKSAHSPTMSQKRERILSGAILGLAGPGTKIAAVCPCTVIRQGDLADALLSPDKHPEWQGQRCQMLYSFPTNRKLWDEYAEILRGCLRDKLPITAATEFYRQHRAEMDEGAVVAWPERHNPDELSAVQHAMNLYLRDPQAFFAEYQNQPLPEQTGQEEELTADAVAAKINRLRRGAVPIGCNHLVMFIDVHQRLLYYLVAAWEDDFTGCVIDYGTYPKQQRTYFTLREARPTLASVTRAGGVEGAIYAGLERLTAEYLAREFHRDDGALLRIERCLVDANWGQATDVVYQFCRQSAHAAVLMPSHGRFIGASSRPLNDYQRKPGDRCGLNWRIPNVQGRRAVRYVIYDTNFWKSFVHERLAVAMGERGCLALFGDRPEQHRLLAEHITAEYRVKTEGRGRTVDEWKLRVSGSDNHWLDCLAGCAVAGSMVGCSPPGTAPAARAARKPRIRYL